MTDTQPRVIDFDDGGISVRLDGKDLRVWEYRDEAEQRTKMLCAREYVEGWCDARGYGAVAQAEQEPFAWRWNTRADQRWRVTVNRPVPTELTAFDKIEPLYTAPQPVDHAYPPSDAFLQGVREAVFAKCAEIADKYNDCGGDFIAQKIRDEAYALPSTDRGAGK